LLTAIHGAMLVMEGSMTADEQSYAFDNALAMQRQRLDTLEALFDPGTIRYLGALGVAPGWRCLEVGAGGGSIAAWLCDRVGPEGTVLATDLDTTWVAEVARPNLEVRTHDLLADDLPEGEFDLVHVRLVLAWLQPDPRAGLRRLIAAVKPGGWLLVEEMDFVTSVADPRMDAEPRELFERVVDAHNDVLAERHAFDPFYGRSVAADLEAAGLADTGCEGRTSMWRGGGPGGRIWQLTIAQIRDAIVESGRMSAADVDAALALCADPRLVTMSPLVMAAWGRRV
jgi:SAM-dependent methyltransferase